MSDRSCRRLVFRQLSLYHRFVLLARPQEFDDLLSATPADLIGSISLFVLGRTVTVTVIPQREFISAHESRDPNIILGVTLSTTLLMTALLIIVSIVMRNYTQVKAKHLLVQERER